MAFDGLYCTLDHELLRIWLHYYRRECGVGIEGMFLMKVGIGTIVWKIEDDLGQSDDIRLPLHVAEEGVCLFSPQHWSQHANKHCFM